MDKKIQPSQESDPDVVVTAEVIRSDPPPGPSAEPAVNHPAAPAKDQAIHEDLKSNYNKEP